MGISMGIRFCLQHRLSLAPDTQNSRWSSSPCSTIKSVEHI